MHKYVLLVSDGEFNLDPLIMQQFSDMRHSSLMEVL